MPPAPKLHTLLQFVDDVALSDLSNEKLEYVDGRVTQKTLPGGRHGRLENRIGSRIGTLFDRKARPDGQGGWWIMTEASVLYRAASEQGRILTADVAGWKRDRVPEWPDEYPIASRPDWICEVSHSTRRKDTTLVPETLAAEGVPWYWMLDALAENLLVFALSPRGYVLHGSFFREDGDVLIPPFDAVPISLPYLLGDDLED